MAKNINKTKRYFSASFAVRLAMVIPFVLTMTACGPVISTINMNEIPREQRAAVAKIKIFKSGAFNEERFDYIGPIEGTSCKNKIWDDPASKSDATEQAKHKAMTLGANAIIDFSCTSNGTDAWGTNCWESVQCGGIAILLKK